MPIIIVSLLIEVLNNSFKASQFVSFFLSISKTQKYPVTRCRFFSKQDKPLSDGEGEA